MGTIILGVDFKENTMEICKQAVLFAKKLKSSITIVHAVEYTPYFPSYPYDQEKINEFHTIALEYETKSLEKFFNDHGVKVEAPIIKYGIPHMIICEAANKLNANAILIGVGNHFIFDRFIGTTAEKVVNSAAQRVIVLNHNKEAKVKKVMCAYDFSENSTKALESAIRFCLFFNSELIVTHVMKTESDQDFIKAKIEHKLKRIIESQRNTFAKEHDFKYKVRVFSGDPVTIVTEMVEAMDIDILSIGPSSQNSLRHLFLGSTVKKILRNAPCTISVTPKDAISNWSMQKNSA